MIKVQTLKGFRDFLPDNVAKRQYVLDTLKKVFSLYGFEPLETPALEYEEVLTGKYGGEGEKMMYKFEDNGKRKVALRYDQTVPLARVVAEYQNELPIPFKRYQIQNVWRAENTQKGRYREFLQVDADTVGVYSPLADAEIISLASKSLEKLGFKKYKILINDRNIFSKLSTSNFQTLAEFELGPFIRSLDKLKKAGFENVVEELVKFAGMDRKRAETLINAVQNEQPTPMITELFQTLEKMGIDNKLYEFLPTLARGLDYYTRMIFEVEVEGYDGGSIAGGGRYDNLVGIFAGKDIPAVGFSFGFDRLIEAMEELGLFPKNMKVNDVFVAFSNSDLQEKAMDITNKLRNENINAEFFLEDATLERQLKYADKKRIPYSLIIEGNNLILKDMEKRTQENLTLEKTIEKLK